MNLDLFVVIVCVSSLVVGVLFGIILQKYIRKRQEKKLIKNAEEVLDGKRENKIKIDGKEYDANRFKVRDDDDKEVIIDIQKGGEVQHDNKDVPRNEEISDQEAETVRETGESARENSTSSRRKKRTTQTGSVKSRARRFG